MWSLSLGVSPLFCCLHCGGSSTNFADNPRSCRPALTIFFQRWDPEFSLQQQAVRRRQILGVYILSLRPCGHRESRSTKASWQCLNIVRVVFLAGGSTFEVRRVFEDRFVPDADQVGAVVTRAVLFHAELRVFRTRYVGNPINAHCIIHAGKIQHHVSHNTGSEWMNEWMSEWVSEWVGEWVGGWMDHGLLYTTYILGASI